MANLEIMEIFFVCGEIDIYLAIGRSNCTFCLQKIAFLIKNIHGEMSVCVILLMTFLIYFIRFFSA